MTYEIRLVKKTGLGGVWVLKAHELAANIFWAPEVFPQPQIAVGSHERVSSLERCDPICPGSQS